MRTRKLDTDIPLAYGTESVKRSARADRHLKAKCLGADFLSVNLSKATNSCIFMGNASDSLPLSLTRIELGSWREKRDGQGGQQEPDIRGGSESEVP